MSISNYLQHRYVIKVDIRLLQENTVETIVLLSNRNLREKEHLKVEIDMDEFRKVKGE